MSAITIGKLRAVLNTLRGIGGTDQAAYITPDCTGELKISFCSQPTREVHDYLISVGFVLADTLYIYRPR